MKTIDYTTRIAVISAALVILAAGVLSFTALRDLFVSIGLFAPWLGYLFPLLFDLAEIAAAVSVFNAKLQGEEDRFAWGMVILFTILGIVANVAHAGHAYYVGTIDGGQVILAVFFTSMFPLSVALVTHLLKHVIGRDISRRQIVTSLLDLTRQLAERTEALENIQQQQQLEVSTLENTRRQIEEARAQLREVQAAIEAGKVQQIAGNIQEMNEARQAKIEARRQDVFNLLREGFSNQEIATRLEVSERTVRNDVKALNGKVEAAR